jgi:hypothetical protein
LLHQVGDLFELNVKLRCQKVNVRHQVLHPHKTTGRNGFPYISIIRQYSENQKILVKMLAGIS